MSTGRNANKAANREAAQAEREAPLRRQIAALERQVQDLDRANLAQQVQHVETVRRLTVHVSANTSEALNDAEDKIAKVTEERDVAQQHVLRIQDKWQTVAPKILDYLRRDYGEDRALEVLVKWLGASPNSLVVRDEEKAAARKMTPSQVRALRLARRGTKGKKAPTLDLTS